MARIKKIKKGATVCTVEDLCFPVTLHNNPRRTNKEYSFVVTGIIKALATEDASIESTDEITADDERR